MKSTELHVTTVRLHGTRWGSFDLRLEVTNTAGAWTGVTLQIPWLIWPLIAAAAAVAWFTSEKKMRAGEMLAIEATLPAEQSAALTLAKFEQPQVQERRAA